MKSGFYLFILMFCSLFSVSAKANPISSVSCNALQETTEKTELTFAISGSESINYRIINLDQPSRVIIDFTDGILNDNCDGFARNTKLIKGLRRGVKLNGDARLVIDLEQKARVKSYADAQGMSTKLRVLLLPDRAASIMPSATVLIDDPGSIKSLLSDNNYLPLLAIDPGHGGVDSGAIGTNGTQEKTITLSVAHQLKRLIDQGSGLRAMLTRDGDYYVSLKDRPLLAKRQNADLFLSIHADADETTKASGSTVFNYVNRDNANPLLRWLSSSEEKENSLHRIGIDNPQNTDLISKILLGLTAESVKSRSLWAGKNVLNKMAEVSPLHANEVKYNAYSVLRSPDMPSILVELAFISNPRDEQKLVSSDYQNRWAMAILKGVKSYFGAYPRTQTDRYFIVRGEDAAKNLQANIRAEQDTTGKQKLAPSRKKTIKKAS